jgi:hypothetical protein
MGTITFRVRSVVWFTTGSVLAAAVTLIFASAWRVDAAPGEVDSTFVAITPCRLADTRPAPNRVGAADSLSAGEIQTFIAVGENGRCTIPSDAIALSLNVTALGATDLSFLTFWPGGARPLAASLNPAPDQPPVPNAVTTDLSAAGGFDVYNDAGSVNVVIDVNGYHTRASLQEISQRLVALESGEEGVDPALVARVDALEADVTELQDSNVENIADIAANATDIADHTAALATNAAGIEALTVALAANSAGIEALDLAKPFAVGDRVASTTVTATASVVASVTVTAPVDGQVTVASTTQANEGFTGDGVECSITTGEFFDTSHVQRWESPGQDGQFSQLAGTRTYDIAADQTVTYTLECEHVGASPTSDLRDTVVTAIFTPAG